MITPRSPFARRVRLALRRLDIRFEEKEETPLNPSQDFLSVNPLGLVPVLRLLDGRFLPDSALILDYLHENHGQKIWPQNSEQKIDTMILSNYAQGIMTAIVNYFFETQKPSPAQDWVLDFEQTVVRTLEALYAHADHLVQEMNQASWDTGVVLEYLDLRMPHMEWRKKFPNFEKVLKNCRESEDFIKTSPPPM